MDLKKANVLVTGGSSGIGLETARALVEAGSQVVICGKDQKKLEEAALITGAHPIVADVSREKEVVELVRQTIEYLGNYNVLINNAGCGAYSSLLDIEATEMRRVWETNVLGATLAARETAKFFTQKNYGNIVNIASTAAHKGYPGGTIYASSKFAVTALTECWRSELRGSNIRVMQVNPSEVITSFYQRAGLSQKDNPSKLHPEDIAHAIINALSMHDRGFTTDVTVWATNPQ